MKRALILPAIIVFFFISCSSGNSAESSKPTDSATANYDASLPTGKITDSVLCKNGMGESYALYLPSNYTASKAWPCIFFFDAHARGTLPVRLYKDLAEKYGFVLAGSNDSKNGTPWQQTNEEAKTLIADVEARINVNAQRIYTAGFSGGSRVASSIALEDGGIAGVIGCAAGFPDVQPPFQNKFDYFGMAGDYDFNLSEMSQLDRTLAQNGFNHQLLTFSGKHGWAPADDFGTGMLWMQVNAMKENRQPKNEILTDQLQKDYDKRIAAAMTSGDLIKAHELLAGMTQTLDGLTDISKYKKQLADLDASDDYKNAAARQTQLQQEEQHQQQTFAQEFTSHDAAWWAREIATLSHSAKNTKDLYQSLMNQRLINFLGLISYLNANHAINTGDTSNATTYLKIFKMADPKNPDCSYLTALYYIKQGNQQKAMTYLQEAAKLGYSDAGLLADNPAFSPLQNNASFKHLIDMVKQNAAKEM